MSDRSREEPNVITNDSGKSDRAMGQAGAAAAVRTAPTTNAATTGATIPPRPTPASTPAPSSTLPDKVIPAPQPQPPLSVARPDLSRNPSASRPPSRTQHDLPSRPDSAAQGRGRYQDRERHGDGPSGPPNARHPAAGPDRQDRPIDPAQQRFQDRYDNSRPRGDNDRPARGDYGARDNRGRLGPEPNNRPGDHGSHNRENPRDVRNNNDNRREETKSVVSRSQTATPAAQARPQQITLNPGRAALINPIDLTHLADSPSLSVVDLIDSPAAAPWQIDVTGNRGPRPREDDTMSRASGSGQRTEGGRNDQHYENRRHVGNDDRRQGYDQLNSTRGNQSQDQSHPQRDQRPNSSYGAYPDESRRGQNAEPQSMRMGDRNQQRFQQDQPRLPRRQDDSYGRLNTGASSPPDMPSANDIPVNIERRRNMNNGTPADTQVSNGRAPPLGPGGHPQDRSQAGMSNTNMSNGLSGPSDPYSRPTNAPASMIQNPPVQVQSAATVFPQNANNHTPSGPRRMSGRLSISAVNGPTQPNQGRPLPTGPASNQDRRFAGVNGTLQQGGQQLQSPVTQRSDYGANDNSVGSIRGRATRQNPQGSSQYVQSAAINAPPPPPTPTGGRIPLPPQEMVMQATQNDNAQSSSREDVRGPRAAPLSRDGRFQNRNQQDLPASGVDDRSRNARNGPSSAEQDTRHHDTRSQTGAMPATSASNTNDNRGERPTYDRGASERDSRRTRDRAHDAMPPQNGPQAAPHQAQSQQPPAAINGGRELRNRGPDRDRDSRDSGRGGPRDRDHQRPTNGPGLPMQQQQQQQQPQQQMQQPQQQQQQQQGYNQMQNNAPVGRPPMPPQDELFQSHGQRRGPPSALASNSGPGPGPNNSSDRRGGGFAGGYGAGPANGGRGGGQGGGYGRGGFEGGGGQGQGGGNGGGNGGGGGMMDNRDGRDGRKRPWPDQGQGGGGNMDDGGKRPRRGGGGMGMGR